MSEFEKAGYSQHSRPLTFDAAVSICEKLFPLCIRRQQIAKELATKDFTAFRPRFEFAYSFCENDEERQFFEKCEIERTKEAVLSAARLVPYFGGPMDVDYPEPSSPFLNKLRQERDRENQCRPRDLERRYSFEEAKWRREYDPVLRRIAQLPPNVFESYQAKNLDEEWSLFNEEVKSHKGEMINAGSRTRRKLCNLFLDVAGSRLKNFDFELIGRKSPRYYPTLTKQLNEFWDLRFGPQQTRFWKYSPLEKHRGRPWNRFSEFQLVICHSDIHEKVSDYAVPSNNILQIRYDFVLSGFAETYRTFFDSDDLELGLLAHTAMLELVLPELEKGFLSEEFLNSGDMAVIAAGHAPGL